MADAVFSRWDNPKYRWYYDATTYPVVTILFVFTRRSVLLILVGIAVSLL
ncbi:hypothetical protein [Haloarchaeobius sp. FL176]|nr:hypothetical protein [Haloarchaeobius sp. FL176]